MNAHSKGILREPGFEPPPLGRTTTTSHPGAERSINSSADGHFMACSDGFLGLALLRVGKFESVILSIFDGKKNLVGGFNPSGKY